MALLATTVGCAVAPSDGLLPVDSDAFAELDPDRDVVLIRDDGRPLRVTSMPGAEDMESVSPDGTRVAFVGGATGIAAVYVAEISEVGVVEPVQLTNVDLGDRGPGEAPSGFVPLPDDGVLTWEDDTTLSWRSGGEPFGVEVPR